VLQLDYQCCAVDLSSADVSDRSRPWSLTTSSPMEFLWNPYRVRPWTFTTSVRNAVRGGSAIAVPQSEPLAA
jgi:hypothetical protein